jgi:hypothetical protein
MDVALVAVSRSPETVKELLVIGHHIDSPQYHLVARKVTRSAPKTVAENFKHAYRNGARINRVSNKQTQDVNANG